MEAQGSITRNASVFPVKAFVYIYLYCFQRQCSEYAALADRHKGRESGSHVGSASCARVAPVERRTRERNSHSKALIVTSTVSIPTHFLHREGVISESGGSGAKKRTESVDFRSSKLPRNVGGDN